MDVNERVSRRIVIDAINIRKVTFRGWQEAFEDFLKYFPDLDGGQIVVTSVELSAAEVDNDDQN